MTPAWPPDLLDLLAGEAATAAPPEVLALAEAARAEVGGSTVAVLFYGSALREGSVEGKLVDLYAVTDGYEGLRAAWPLRLLVRLVPPNVYYLETASGGGIVRAKYAVVALDHLRRLVGRETDNPYFWARFAQPTAIAWAGDEAVRTVLVDIFAQASDTLLAAAGPAATSRDRWIGAFSRTYRTELRAEPPSRSVAIYDVAPARYDRIAAALADRPLLPGGEAAWTRRRILGKLLSVLRLVKAASTFTGGPDYLAWKIERHSGVKVELTPWQRRHPILAAPGMFWRLYRRGAFR
ncbi:MAG TPA: hypothetical protein PKA13_15635 [Geminicoccaceae bacterium]|nr:hypothetical protein [Geminicoccus sp.]HMU51206.1 hypothetical protein [Geminicoccaceae bacterium]